MECEPTQDVMSKVRHYGFLCYREGLETGLNAALRIGYILTANMPEKAKEELRRQIEAIVQAAKDSAAAKF